MPNVKKICLTCGCNFEAPQWRPRASTCSTKCAGVQTAKRYAESRVKKICPVCKKKFEVPKCHAERQTYCSRECADTKRGESHIGNKHSFKTGYTNHRDGYLYVMVESHPLAMSGRYVLEHRIVMEQWMLEKAPKHPFLVEIDGVKCLDPEIVVHHIDEDKRNNKRKNLLACTKYAHKVIHNGEAPMQGEVWPEIKGLKPYQPRRVTCTCGTCGKEFEMRRTAVESGRGKFCDRLCYLNRDTTPFKVRK